MSTPNYETRAPGILACAIVLIVVSSLAVILRFWSRTIVVISARFWWDDWAVLATLVVSHLFLAIIIYWTTVGLGRHSWMIPVNNVIPNAITNRVGLVIYATTIFLIKISALLLYARLFYINRKFVVVLWVVGVAATIWWIITATVPWSFCHPLHKGVNPFIRGHCYAVSSWYTASAFINASMDLIVLLLPMPMIWRVQASLHRRVSVTLVLLLGYCSAFLSFARFIIIIRDPDLLSAGSPASDQSWTLVPLLYLSMLEAPFAIMALCGPSISHLVSRAVKHRSLASLFTSRRFDTPLITKSGDTSGKHDHRVSNESFCKIGDPFPVMEP